MNDLINLNTPLLERLLRYVKVFTTSDAASNTVPSTPQQWDLLRLLEQEMQKMGLSEITLDDKGYLFASLPANVDDAPVLGLLAHVDTAPDFNGKDVRPQIIEDYDGQAIALKGSGDELSPEQFPNLTALLGHKLVTTDGTSLLGADDKSGIAIILSVIEYLQAHPDIPHGKLRVGFTPDEEIGRGPKHFDVEKFGADFAYTLDGGPLGELQFENFNAAEATVTFFGRAVHPGSAKGKMINAWERACEFQAALPAHLTPATSEGKEGFIYLRKIDGSLERCQLHYALRDFERAGLDEKEAQLRETLQAMRQRYGEKCGQLDVVQHYANMREKVADYPQLIEVPKQVMANLGITPNLEPIRGGTDGAQLSFMGLPTPNLFTGGENFHGKFEFISLDVMNQAANVLLGTIVALSKKA
ncbi:peptidase T [Pasteurellaceae bacterium TAE3-ERU1]|nr:peptidase T [Pasteurellaceae bacterium TAE3-ERU1]